MTITKVSEAGFTTASGTGSESKTLPGTVLENDIVLVSCGTDFSLSDALPAPGSGDGGIGTSGYAEIAIHGGSQPATHSGWKRMGSTPDTSVLIYQDTNRIIAGAIQVWRGVDTTTAIDNGVSSASGTGAPNPPSHTTVTNDALRVILGWLDDSNEEANVIAPSGYSNLIAKEAGAATNSSHTMMIASKIEASFGAANPAEFGGGLNESWWASHFAFRPALAGSGWSGKVNGITNIGKINGVSVADIVKVNAVA